MSPNRRTIYCILSCRPHELKTASRLRPYQAGRHSVYCVLRGNGEVRIQGQSFPVRAGAFLFAQPGDRIEWLVTGEHTQLVYLLHYAAVRFDPSDRSGTGCPADSRIARRQPIVLPASSLSDLRSLLDPLVLHLRMKGVASEWKQQQLFYELLGMVEEHTEPNSSPMPQSIERALNYMKGGYMRPLALSRLPQLAGMTPSSFCRAFKRSTGKTPGDYLSNLRIERAKQLLAEPYASLKDIARNVGFQDELYFSRVFKNNVGLSPTSYRRQQMHRVAIVSHLFLQDHLLSLGVAPLAAPSYPSYYATRGFPRYLCKGMEGTTALNAERSIRWEEVARLNPDIVVKMNFLHNPYDDHWKEDGKTVYFEGFPNWDGYLRAFAGMLDKECEAESIIERIRQAEKSAKDAVLPFARRGTWSIVRVMKGDFRLYTGADHSFTDLFYRALGFQPKRLETGVGPYRQDALPELANIDPDRILVLWSDAQALAKLESNEIWRGLRAYREGQIYIPESYEWDAWGPAGRLFTIRECIRYFSSFD